MRRLPFLLAFAVGCHGEPAPPQAPGTPTAKVEFATPKRQAIAWIIDQPGTVHAFEVTPVVAKLPGFVAKVNADIGDRVEGPKFDAAGMTTEQGQVLAELAVPEQEWEAKQKTAAVALAAAEVDQAQASTAVAVEMVAATESAVKEEQAALRKAAADTKRWASELKRVEGLSDGRVVDAQTLDEARRQAAAAQATEAEHEARVVSAQVAVRAATAKKARAEADTAAAVAKRAVAEADAAKAVAVLEYTRIRAPFTGYVTARNVHTGHFLQMGAAVFTVARLDTVRVFVEVPEASAAVAIPGAAVTIRIPALNQREVAATITRTARALSSDARTLRVEIDLPNTDGSLTPGLYCTASIRAGTPDALVLPAGAILYADETAYCFLALGGKIVKMRVQVGHTGPWGVEVVRRRPAGTTAGGWTPFDGGERVAVGNLGALADGQTVDGSVK